MKIKKHPFDRTGGNPLLNQLALPGFFQRRIYILLAFVLLIWFIALLFALADIKPIISRLRDVKRMADHQDIHYCKFGPWGRLHYSRITVEPPAGFLTPENTAPKPTKWFFKGYTKESLTTFMEQTGLTDDQKKLFFEQTRWETDPGGITVFPATAFILEITPEARATIYLELGLFDENNSCQSPFTFNTVPMDDWLESSGLSDGIQALIRHLSYDRGAKKAFSDDQIVLAELGTPAERINFFKAISRTTSLFPMLHITRNSDIEAIARYWMKNSKAKDIRPLLKSAACTENGYDLDLVHLLPPIPRARAYTYPNPAKTDPARPPDCHWTTLNFFNTRQDDSCLPGNSERWHLGATYYEVAGKPAFGDIMLFFNADMKPIHSCSYIADDLVLTKNGLSTSRPWIFMKLADVIRNYEYTDFEILTLRRRGS